MTKPDLDHDNDNDQHEPIGKAVASTPTGGALASLAALGAVLNRVDTAAVVGSGMPMLQFKREGDGTWMYGQKRTIVEDGSRWAVNPLTFRYGFICFGDGIKRPDERLVSVSQPMPDAAELPNTGFPWVPQWAVNLKCLDGADAGVEAAFKVTTVGGVQSVAGLIESIRDRINGGQHDGKIAPVVQLRKDSYAHAQYGKVWTPRFEIIDWMALSGPAPAPASAPSTEQPRRRRVG